MPGEIEAVADKGYYKGEEIVACEQAGITVTVSKPHTSNAAAAGRFDRADFVYHSEQDAHLCPAGQRLAYHYTNKEAGKVLRNYWTNACQDCVVKHRCTTGSDASDAGEHEDILERVQKRLDDDARKIPLQSKTVEHSLRHDQVMDWGDARQDENIEARGDRDGPARARLQHDARDDDHRRAETRKGNAGVKRRL